MLNSRQFINALPKRTITHIFSRLHSSLNTDPSNSKLANLADKQMTKNLGLFLTKENRQTDLLDSLLKLRKCKDASTVPIFPNAVAQNILASSSTHELIPVLSNPVQYGVFVDEYTGFSLMTYLLNNEREVEAAQIAQLVVEQDKYNNELVVALCLQSIYALLKNYTPPQVPETPEKKAASVEVEKIRVKFIRNVQTENTTQEYRLGQCLIKLCETGTVEIGDEVKQNFILLGLALCQEIERLELFVDQNSTVFFKEVLELCPIIVKDYRGTVLQKAIDNCNNTNSFGDKLVSIVKHSVEAHSPKLNAAYAKSYEEWEKGFQKAVEEQLKQQDLNTRIKTAQTTLDAINANRQHYWFFENQDDIEIQIYNKRVYYPKRWFGKKKKPRAVDAFYVPPNVTQRS